MEVEVNLEEIHKNDSKAPFSNQRLLNILGRAIATRNISNFCIKRQITKTYHHDDYLFNQFQTIAWIQNIKIPLDV